MGAKEEQMSLRVASGVQRGTRLHSPAPGTRPTSEVVRQAIFSMLSPGLVQGARVLDLYAGTGALGIEALSHGAASVDFVEVNLANCAVIRENLRRTGFTGRGRVHQARAERALRFLAGPYRLVLMDPSYSDLRWTVLLPELVRLDLLESEGAVVAEHARRLPPLEAYPGLVLERRRTYGETQVSIYRRHEAGG